MNNSAIRHWKLQRFTSVLLIPLVIWFVISLAEFETFNSNSLAIWYEDTVNALLLVILSTIVLWHGILGFESIIDDYISNSSKRKSTMSFIKIVAISVWLMQVAAIVKFW